MGRAFHDPVSRRSAGGVACVAVLPLDGLPRMRDVPPGDRDIAVAYGLDVREGADRWVRTDG
jgi:hypothetical protein